MYYIKGLFTGAATLADRIYLRSRQKGEKSLFMLENIRRRKFYYAVSTKSNLLFAFHNCTREFSASMSLLSLSGYTLRKQMLKK
jgi:hypothetical protein